VFWVSMCYGRDVGAWDRGRGRGILVLCGCKCAGRLLVGTFWMVAMMRKGLDVYKRVWKECYTLSGEYIGKV